jgi:putative membrane protein
VSTLVVCIDRNGAFTAGVETPVVGRDAIESLLVDVGIDDPEDSRVNCLLEGLRVADDLAADDEAAIVSVLSGAADPISADRNIASQVDDLIETHDPDSAIVVVDSAEDERLVPIIESRIPVDAVDRVVVRQARDIESTYYLLKQFLADEELRKTVLVPVGVALLVFPLLLLVLQDVTVAVGAIAAVIGLFLLYKGLSVDERLSRLSSKIQTALYAGQVALVTYVVAAGLGFIGLFVGALGVSATETTSELLLAMRFIFESVPWIAAGALAASIGRLLDELLHEDAVGTAYLNLPFLVVAVGLVVRGIATYFLERAAVFAPMVLPSMQVGPLSIDQFSVSPRARLAIFLIAGVLVSLVGVRFAAHVTETGVEEEFADSGPQSPDR